MDPKNKKLRALVYAGLAGGLVGVCATSAVAHGNASSHNTLNQTLTWEADNFTVVDLHKPQQDKPAK